MPLSSHRDIAAVCALVAIGACRSKSTAHTLDNSSRSDAASAGVDPTITVNTADAAHTEAELLLDVPAWPANTQRLELTWVLYPKVDEPAKGTQRFVVELVVRAGSVARRHSMMQFGTGRGSTYEFDVREQLGCHGMLRPPKVASLFLGGGGYVQFDVARVGDDLVLSKVDLCAPSTTDGKCDVDVSPVAPGTLARIPVPHDAIIEEHFHVVENATVEHDERCPPKSP